MSSARATPQVAWFADTNFYRMSQMVSAQNEAIISASALMATK